MANAELTNCDATAAGNDATENFIGKFFLDRLQRFGFCRNCLFVKVRYCIWWYKIWKNSLRIDVYAISVIYILYYIYMAHACQSSTLIHNGAQNSSSLPTVQCSKLQLFHNIYAMHSTSVISQSDYYRQRIRIKYSVAWAQILLMCCQWWAKYTWFYTWFVVRDSMMHCVA